MNIHQLHFFRDEMEKQAKRFQVTADILRGLKLPGAAAKVERTGGRLSDKIYRALEWKIPGTGNTKIMPTSTRKRLSRTVGDNPHLMLPLLTPIPGGTTATLAVTKLLERGAARRGLGVRV
jgi:hypothetical protein